MVTNPIIEALKSRRAVRSYEEKAVPESAVQTILEAATYSPTAINIQPWKFTIVTNKEEMKRFSDMAKGALLQTLPDVADEGLERFKNSLKNPQFNIFYGAPLLVFISGAKSSQFAVNDCSMAAQNMMLAAYSLGLGSCWIGGAMLYANTKGKAELGVPEDHQVFAAVIFGYPKGDFPKAPPKKPAEILKRIG